jgi:hypothetical protein
MTEIRTIRLKIMDNHCTEVPSNQRQFQAGYPAPEYATSVTPKDGRGSPGGH